jgi:hypothetical protein
MVQGHRAPCLSREYLLGLTDRCTVAALAINNTTSSGRNHTTPRDVTL